MTKANEAKEKTEIASITEEIQREILEEQLKSTRGNLTAEALEAILTSKGTLSTEENILDRTLTTTKGGYEIPVRDIWDGTLSGGGSGLTDTADTKPGAAMPSGAEVIEADPSKGIVIKDSKNNEWVWIEVPKTTVFKTATASNQYDNIEADLIAYAGAYREGAEGQGENWTDEWYAMDGETLVTASTEGLTDTQRALNNGCGLTYDEYQSTYQTMLSSVYTNGGFWIGRYEAGISGSDTDMTKARTYDSDITNDSPAAVSNADMIPYNYVSCSEAQTLASKMSPDSRKTSSLMFGIQWDLVCKFLEVKSDLEIVDINSDSGTWGNYYYVELPITSANAKQSEDWGKTWSSITGTKAQNSSILLSTGASNNTRKMNIYDFAGNECEWTLEKTSDTNYPWANRSSFFESDRPASERSPYTDSSIGDGNGGVSFRPSLY